MKKIVLILVVLAVVASMGWSQANTSVSILLGGNLFAPLGVGVEFFLSNFGIVGELRGLFLSTGGEVVGTVEPGVYGRFYFSELDSSMYLVGGVSYFTGWSGSSVAQGGLLRPRGGVGYSALFGKDERTRFHMELGACWSNVVADGDLVSDFPALLLPYILLGFGRVF